MQGIVNAVVPRFTDAFIKKTRQCNRNIDNSFGYQAIMSHDLISEADQFEICHARLKAGRVIQHTVLLIATSQSGQPHIYVSAKFSLVVDYRMK